MRIDAELAGPPSRSNEIVSLAYARQIAAIQAYSRQKWFLPNANNIPLGYARQGTFYDTFRNKFKSTWGVDWAPGTAVFQYGNSQSATTLWYHDHSLGMTRLNVYAGPAGFYLLRGGPGDLPPGVLPGPAPGVGADPFGTHYEIPIAIRPVVPDQRRVVLPR